MEKVILIFVLFFQLTFSFCQQKEKLSIFKNTKNWKREIIKFPIDWAPDLKVVGFEELLFSPEWSTPKNNQFWSLVIGWKINAESFLTLKEIKYNLKNYFDGLMKPNHWAVSFPNPKIHLISNSNNKFTGQMKFFDGFHTGKTVTVNILIEQYLCRKQHKAIIVFRVSPKSFQHNIWKDLNGFELNRKNCN